MQSDEAVKAELHNLKIKWEKTIQTLKEVRVSPLEDMVYREELANEKGGLLYRYVGNISGDTFNEILYTIRAIRIDLNLSLQRGRQNYDDEKHRRRIEMVVKILLPIFLVILILIVKFVFNIEIPFLQ